MKKIYKHSVSELSIQKRILKWLKDSYPNAVVAKLKEAGINGLPDIMCIHDTVAYFFEVKSPKGKPTKLQLFTIKRLISAGAIAHIVKSLDDVKEIM